MTQLVSDHFSCGGSPSDLDPLGGMVTGNMVGLEYHYSTATAITVDSGTCWDSLNSTVIVRNGTADVTLDATTIADGSSPAINTVYNIFVLGNGTVNFDTDVDGVNITEVKRWIGFILTDGAGDICVFEVADDTMIFTELTAIFVSAPIPTAFSQRSIASVVPVTRVESVTIKDVKIAEFGALYTSADGTAELSYAGIAGGPHLYNEGWYLKTVSATYDNANISIATALMRR